MGPGQAINRITPAHLYLARSYPCSCGSRSCRGWGTCPRGHHAAIRPIGYSGSRIAIGGGGFQAWPGHGDGGITHRINRLHRPIGPIAASHITSRQAQTQDQKPCSLWPISRGISHAPMIRIALYQCNQLNNVENFRMKSAAQTFSSLLARCHKCSIS